MSSGLPLNGVRVIDMTIARAGPTTVRQLADWGADVVRIDIPEASESFSTERHGSDFQNLHRNKRSLSLDLKHPDAQRLFREQLVPEADVLVENFRAGVKHRLGVDYDTVRELNPRLVYGSISGFGQDGPYASRPGVDQIAQGIGGLMSVTGLPGQGPVRAGIPVSDLAAGLYLAFGIVLALYERERSGEGQWVHTSLLEAQIGFLDLQAARWLVDGEVPPQAGNHHPTMIPMGLFPAADGHVNIAAPRSGKFADLCRELGAEELLEDPDFATSRARSHNRDRLNEALGKHTARHAMSDLVNRLNDAGIPCGPVHRVSETFDDPQVRHLGIAAPLEHPELGTLRLVGQPVHLGRHDPAPRTAAPDPGEHTGEVLRELGLSDDDITQLRRDGAV